MSNYSFLPLTSLRPFSPRGSNTPKGRRLSMTQVVSPADTEAWNVASRASQGSVLDATMLRAEATRYGATVPGWVGESTQFVRPSSYDG